MKKLVQAQDLKVGDKLISGGVVTHKPYVDIKTPSRKINLGVNGYLKTWNKTTVIAINNEL